MADSGAKFMLEQADQPPRGHPAISLYVNGFVLGLSNADVHIVTLLDGNPQAKLHLSYTTAKTLSKLLSELVSKLERATNHDIMITEVVAEALAKLAENEKQ